LGEALLHRRYRLKVIGASALDPDLPASTRANS